MLNKFIVKAKLIVFMILVFTPMVVGAAPVLWSGDSYGRLGTVDIVTGDVNIVGNMGIAMTDIAFDPSGNLWGITFTGLYKIDKDTASTTFVGNLGTSANSLAFDSSGVLYTANRSLYTVDTSSGAAHLVGSGGDAYSSSGDLAFLGNDLYLSSAGDHLLNINTSDGSGALIGGIGYSSVYGLASPDGIDLYGLTGTEILTIDPETGQGISLIDYSGQGLGPAWGSAFDTEAVPVPAAAWLLGSGLLALVGLRRRNP